MGPIRVLMGMQLEGTCLDEKGRYKILVFTITMGRDATKSVSGISIKFKIQPACYATETS